MARRIVSPSRTSTVTSYGEMLTSATAISRIVLVACPSVLLSAKNFDRAETVEFGDHVLAGPQGDRGREAAGEHHAPGRKMFTLRGKRVHQPRDRGCGVTHHGTASGGPDQLAGLEPVADEQG